MMKIHVSPIGWRRLTEIALIAFITSLLIVFAPMAAGCTPGDQLIVHVPGFDSLSGIAAEERTGNLSLPNSICINQRIVQYMRDPTRDFSTAGAEAELIDELFLRNALCDESSSYNQLESLLQSSGHNTVTLLFTEGSYDYFTAGPLLGFLVIYFCMAVIAAGSAIPHGLVIPMLTIGGTLGRIFGLMVNFAFKDPTSRNAIDPGAWAQVGAAAFWCGSGRITATIAVIVLEITGDYAYLPAIGIAVITSKWVGDLMNEGLYHQLIHLKHLHFMGGVNRSQTEGAVVADIMSANPRVFGPFEPIARIQQMLRDTTHNGFPVIEHETLAPSAHATAADHFPSGRSRAESWAGSHSDGKSARRAEPGPGHGLRAGQRAIGLV